VGGPRNWRPRSRRPPTVNLVRSGIKPRRRRSQRDGSAKSRADRDPAEPRTAARTGGRRPALGTRLSTAVTRGIAAWPRDRNASHIASARDPATSEFGAKAKTLDPEPQRPQPVAPAVKAADRASAYPARQGARTGAANRSSRQQPARAAAARASASARLAAWPTVETASRRGTTGGRIFRMSAVRRTNSG